MLMAQHRLQGPAEDNEAYVRAVHDKGFTFDLGTMTRRRMLVAIGGAGALAAVGAQVFLSGGTAAAADCAEEIESETAGPYPADGSNGVEIRTSSGIVRSDIRTSLGTGTTAAGVPLTVTLTIQDLDCAPLAGAAVYLWHADQDGNYSLYSTGVTDEDYLRGIQEADSAGQVTFTSVFPGCYLGRWPHIHFEVYASLADATSGSGPIRKTSQLALPQDASTAVYATDGYDNSTANLSQITLATDNVFSDDGAARQLAAVTGSVTDGFAATLAVTVDPTAEETGGGTPPSGSPPSGPPPGGTASPSATASASPTASATATATATVSATTSTKPVPSGRPTSSGRPAPRPQPRRKRHWWWPF
jgi:protocatechuate 3,4-dioxygenase beta subunit